MGSRSDDEALRDTPLLDKSEADFTCWRHPAPERTTVPEDRSWTFLTNHAHVLLAALDATYVVEDAGDLAPVLRRTAERMASATSP